jgi:ATP-dependent RNA helicase DDX19/DBP5
MEASSNDDIILLKSSEGETVYQSSKTWQDLSLPESMIQCLELKNWTHPTLIQGIAISIIISGQNLVAQSKNGSGKTGSFVIGSLVRVDKQNPGLQVICVSHTRELCQQNFSVFSEFGQRLGISVALPEKNQNLPQVLCLTYGSLRNVARQAKNMENIKVLIYDECDYLFTNEESKNTLLSIQRQVPTAQKVLFSATFSDQVWKTVEDNIENVKSIKIEKKEDLSLDNIDQYVIQCEHQMKFDTVKDIIRQVDLKCCIIFTNTKDYLNRLEAFLEKAGYKVSKIASGIVNDDERAEIVKKVHDGQIKVLITTDVLSRGVDFRLVNLVINLDPPFTYQASARVPDPLTYLHRIGRTGRYGRKGIAVNIISNEESRDAFLSIQGYFSKRFKLIKLDQLTSEVSKVNSDYEV